MTDGQFGANTLVTDPEARKWAMFCHIAQFAGFVFPVGSIIGPLVIWLMKKDEHPFILEQGKEVINFQISLLIYGFVCFLLIFVIIGMLLLPLLILFSVVCSIIGTIKANDGNHYRYPLTIRFLK